MPPILITLFLGVCIWAAACKLHTANRGDIGSADIWGYAWFAAMLTLGMLIGWFFPDLVAMLWGWL